MAGAICALACSNLLAQEAEFDLSSQRLEIQQVLPVPGKKIDHQGIIINPTSQTDCRQKQHAGYDFRIGSQRQTG